MFKWFSKESREARRIKKWTDQGFKLFDFDELMTVVDYSKPIIAWKRRHYQSNCYIELLMKHESVFSGKYASATLAYMPNAITLWVEDYKFEFRQNKTIAGFYNPKASLNKIDLWY